MSRMSKPNAYRQEAEKRRNNFLDVFNATVTKCSVCDRPSSKGRIYSLPDGLFCKYCLPADIPPVNAEQAEADYKAHLEAQKNAPKPESYGEWA